MSVVSDMDELKAYLSSKGLTPTDIPKGTSTATKDSCLGGIETRFFPFVDLSSVDCLTDHGWQVKTYNLTGVI